MSQSTYLFMAGGTGGHIFPALAVAKELQQRGSQVHWLGTSAGMEAHLVPAENIKLHTIEIKGFRGKRVLAKLMMPILLCRAVFQAISVIREIQPNAVVGFGGFVAAPGGIAARLLGKKLIIHEQNSVAGTTNKLLNKLANQSLEGFPNSLKKAVHIGNPVRPDICEISNSETIESNTEIEGNKKIKLLITGGSLGAQAINNIVPQVLAGMDVQVRPEIWHQTGKNKKDNVEQAYNTLAVDARIEEFIGDVAAAYRWADIMICRAGALTVSEVAVAGIPAIFIPLPGAIDNHQYHNAKWLADNKAAILIEQKDLTQETLKEALSSLSEHREVLNNMRIQLKKIALPHATEKAANYCEELSHAV